MEGGFHPFQNATVLCTLAFRHALAGIIGANLGALEASGNWYLTKAAVPVGKAEDAFAQVLSGPGDVSNQISATCESTVEYEQVRIWLGRPSFLATDFE